MIENYSAISETCSDILEDILKRTFDGESCLKQIKNASLEADQNCLKEGKSLCNCTQTGEVKILVKKITDLANEYQKPTKNKHLTPKMDTNTMLTKNDITTDTDNDFNDDQRDIIDEANYNNVEQAHELGYDDLCRTDIVTPVLVDDAHCKCQNKGIDDSLETCSCHQDSKSAKQEVTCQSAGQISKDNIEEMSDFLVKACEMRHLRRLSMQEPQVLPEEYEIDEMTDPFASILEQGDHIMDTFHNLLTDNGNLTVRISFSYCAKLLAVLLTLNTIFFSKIIIWDSFLQYLF